jgi:hypothetical protein
VIGSITAYAQQSGRMRRIGVLMSYPETDPDGQTFLAAFREELQKLLAGSRADRFFNSPIGRASGIRHK